jgi:hypothetical protein
LGTRGKNGVLIDMVEVLARKEENGLNGFSKGSLYLAQEYAHMRKGIRIAYFHGGKFLMYVKLKRTKKTPKIFRCICTPRSEPSKC